SPRLCGECCCPSRPDVAKSGTDRQDPAPDANGGVMNWWEALVLGVVQGLTEFFPVSSSGHLVITEDLLGLRLPGVAFDVALHVATLLSVILVYRQRLTDLVLGVLRPGNGKSWRYIGLLVLATIPAAIVGFTFEDWFEARFDDPVFAATMI